MASSCKVRGATITVETVCRGGRNAIFRGGRRNRPCFSLLKNGDLQGWVRDPPLKMHFQGRVGESPAPTNRFSGVKIIFPPKYLNSQFFCLVGFKFAILFYTITSELLYVFCFVKADRHVRTIIRPPVLTSELHCYSLKFELPPVSIYQACS